MYKIIALAMLISSTLAAAPVINSETNHYIVDGKTVQDIRTDMNSKRSGGYDAHTDWWVKWYFYWKDNRINCTLIKVNTVMTVNMMLPELAANGLADPDAKQRWDNYYPALLKHENGHRNFGVNAAKAIEKALWAMGSRDNCATLESEANNLARTVLNKYIADEKQYDLDTNHGLNTGAVFP
jgi:predicted secreted Zn-dependent protease